MIIIGPFYGEILVLRLCEFSEILYFENLGGEVIISSTPYFYALVTIELMFLLPYTEYPTDMTKEDPRNN